MAAECRMVCPKKMHEVCSAYCLAHGIEPEGRPNDLRLIGRRQFFDHFHHVTRGHGGESLVILRSVKGFVSPPAPTGGVAHAWHQLPFVC